MKNSSHYDTKYYAWQRSQGRFGGKAEKFKFQKLISKDSTVLDFGCGGGFLLGELEAKRKIGIEPNKNAKKDIESNGAEYFQNTNDAIMSLGEESIDIIISNHCLEHTLNPFDELELLYRLLKKNGKITFVTPSEHRQFSWKQNDINNHLYTWTPMNLGNLFTEVGFQVENVKIINNKWPPFYQKIANLSFTLFQVFSIIYGHFPTKLKQIQIIAMKNKQ